MLHCVWWFLVQDPHNIVMNELRFGPRLGIKSEINSDFDILCQAGTNFWRYEISTAWHNMSSNLISDLMLGLGLTFSAIMIYTFAEWHLNGLKILSHMILWFWNNLTISVWITFFIFRGESAKAGSNNFLWALKNLHRTLDESCIIIIRF